MAVTLFLLFGIGVVVFGLGFVYLTLQHHKKQNHIAQSKENT